MRKSFPYFLITLFSIGCAAYPMEPKCVDFSFTDFQGNVSKYHCGVLVQDKPVTVITGK